MRFFKNLTQVLFAFRDEIDVLLISAMLPMYTHYFILQWTYLSYIRSQST